jgi:hypothetical protein
MKFNRIYKKLGIKKCCGECSHLVYYKYAGADDIFNVLGLNSCKLNNINVKHCCVCNNWKRNSTQAKDAIKQYRKQRQESYIKHITNYRRA